MIFVDANYILRFLLRDEEQQFRQVKSFFEEAAMGKHELFTSLIVFFEIFWVLTSFYKKNKEEIATTLLRILEMRFILLEERNLLIEAVETYKKQNFGMEDSFNLVYAKARKATSFATFDRKLSSSFS